jgi:hypothetical protein
VGPWTLVTHARPTGTPCLMCGERVDHWDAHDRAQPCGHSWDDNQQEALWTILTVPRARFGEYVKEETDGS